MTGLHIVSDFHGTLYSDTNEGGVMGYIRKRALKDAGIRHPVRSVGLLLTALGLTAEKYLYEHGRIIGYDRIYDLFNRHVLNKVPTHVVMGYAEEYAKRGKTQSKLDRRMLKPIQQASKEGASTAILSTDYKYSVYETLRRFAYDEYENTRPAFDLSHSVPRDFRHTFYFKNIIANPIVPSGNGSRFVLEIYTPDDRLHALQMHLERAGITRLMGSRLIFTADNDEYLPCMEYVKDAGGKIVAPFLATDEFRQRAAREFDAFVPETEQDFANFLRKA